MTEARNKGNTAIETQAVIYLGPDSVSLVIAEVEGDNVRVLDYLVQPASMARDIFRSHKISRHTMDRCVNVIGDFLTILGEYGSGISLSPRLVLSNIIFEAENVDVIINRLHVAHGIRGSVMDDGKMTRLIYLNVQKTLGQYTDFQGKTTMVVHVGPGNTRILLFEKGRITRYSFYRVGAHRTGEAISELDFDENDLAELSVTREHIRGQIDQIAIDYASLDKLDALILIGSEVQHLRQLFKFSRHGKISIEAMGKAAEKMALMPVEQRMIEYGTDFAEVDALLPSILINQMIAQLLKPQQIIIPDARYDQEFQSSLILEDLHPRDLEAEVLHFAGILADRYKADKDHRTHVKFLCETLFAELKDLHRLTDHDLLLLQVAAILHEVGGFISQPNHHIHSQYIILNSEIFGLSRQDVEIVALLARYHRHETPSKEDILYADLDQVNRMRVSKMASILRVADALERGHSRRVHGIKAVVKGKILELGLVGVHDTTVEELAIRLKGDLFADIFGYDIVLVPAR